MRLNSQPDRSGSRTDGDQTRKRLLTAATKVFAARGFDSTPTRAIAAAAKTNIAAIKYYFGDKAGLLTAVIEQSIAAVAEGGQHPMLSPHDDPRHALKMWITWVLKTGRRRQSSHGAASRLMMHALAIRGPLAKKLAAHLGAPVRHNILTLVDQLYPGALEPAVREQAFVFIYSLCSQFARGGPMVENMGIRIPDDDASLDTLAERLTDFVIGGLYLMAENAAKPSRAPLPTTPPAATPQTTSPRAAPATATP